MPAGDRFELKKLDFHLTGNQDTEPHLGSCQSWWSFFAKILKSLRDCLQTFLLIISEVEQINEFQFPLKSSENLEIEVNSSA